MINEKALEEYLEVYTFEEILELCDLLPSEALSLLAKHGYIKLPPFLEDRYSNVEDQDVDEG